MIASNTGTGILLVSLMWITNSARVLAGRLLKVIHAVVAPNQTCREPGRFIGENVALLRDVAHYAFESNIPLAILSLDQEKAFDRVDWDCLLLRMGFGPSFVSWVKLLYTDICSAIVINGYILDSFKPSHGVHQGCPLSPLLYMLSIERPFARHCFLCRFVFVCR